MPVFKALKKLTNKIARRSSKCDASVSKQTKKCDKKEKNDITNKIKRNRRTTRKQIEANPAIKIAAFQDDFSYLLGPCDDEDDLHRGDLDKLTHSLRFPEELAQNLIEAEYEIFKKASPLAFKYFAEDLLIYGPQSLQLFRVTPLTELVRRFAEVRLWVVDLILADDTDVIEKRLGILSCLFRVAKFCYDSGAFNVATQILIGLKSPELKPFWEVVESKEVKLTPLNNLCDIVLAVEPSDAYQSKMTKCLSIPGSSPIPFYGYFIGEIKVILDEDGTSQTAEEHLDKVYSEIMLYLRQTWNYSESDQEDDDDYFADDVAPDVQSLELPESKVTFLPTNVHLNPNDIHIMQQGVTVLSFPSRGIKPNFQCIKLEKDGRTIGWSKPDWSCLPKNEPKPSDYQFRSQPAIDRSKVVEARHQSRFTFLDEAYIDLHVVKEVKCTGYPGDYTYLDKSSQADIESQAGESTTVNFITLVHGESINANNEVRLLLPRKMWRVWSRGLEALVKGLKLQTDPEHQKIKWAKEQYMNLYYEANKCPPTANIIQRFGRQPLQEGDPLLSLVAVLTQEAQAPDIAMMTNTPTQYEEFRDILDAILIHSRKDIMDVLISFAKLKPGIALGTGRSEDEEEQQPEKKGRHLSPQLCNILGFLCVEKNTTGLKNDVMNFQNLVRFLEAEQNEPEPKDTAEGVIEVFERDIALQTQQKLSLIGAIKYLSSDNCDIVDPMEQDPMDRPLSHYYVNSSHNTYLSGRQMLAESSVQMYREVLLNGCRCIELDCWDGEHGMPIITHGYAFCTDIALKDVLETIEKFAFVASPYPLILSIENHCKYEQQQEMAKLMKAIFGEKLLTEFVPGANEETQQLPSPEDLKFKILIRNQKYFLKTKEPQRYKKGRAGSNVSCESISSNENENTNIQTFGELDDVYENGAVNMRGRGLQGGSAKERADTYTMKPIRKTKSDSNFTRRQSDAMDRLPRSKNLQDRRRSTLACRQQRSFDSVVPEENTVFTVSSDSSDAEEVVEEQLSRSASVVSNDSAISISSTVKGRRLSDKTYDREKPESDTCDRSKTVQPQRGSRKEKVAPELSDLVIYSESVRFKETMLTTKGKIAKQDTQGIFQISSVDEGMAKQMDSNHRNQDMVNHTNEFMLRIFPKGSRMDSSNYNPMDFWALGVQMVALNHQHSDLFMDMNRALFEFGGGCGYVLKPDVMTDRAHPLYGQFNPHGNQDLKTTLEIEIISGQFINPSDFKSTVFAAVEIIGIPSDCSQGIFTNRTGDVTENALNPIWSKTFNFQVSFPHVAFLRFSVHSLVEGKPNCLGQRIVPISRLKEGYRHVRLRSVDDQQLPLSTLFVRCKKHGDSLPSKDTRLTKSRVDGKPMTKTNWYLPSSEIDEGRIGGPSAEAAENSEGTDHCSCGPSCSVQVEKASREPGKSTTVVVTNTTTASQLIQMAFVAEGRQADDVSVFELVEETLAQSGQGGELSDRNLRVLGPEELIGEIWQGWEEPDRKYNKFIIAAKGSTKASVVYFV